MRPRASSVHSSWRRSAADRMDGETGFDPKVILQHVLTFPKLHDAPAGVHGSASRTRAMAPRVMSGGAALSRWLQEPSSASYWAGEVRTRSRQVRTCAPELRTPNFVLSLARERAKAHRIRMSPGRTRKGPPAPARPGPLASTLDARTASEACRTSKAGGVPPSGSSVKKKGALAWRQETASESYPKKRNPGQLSRACAAGLPRALNP